ncbi:protein-glutamate O-methyltransferase CheR [Tepidibacillus infernus]|uniref:protein-glutamate O-methyltransferase n=1 Tax=Tepidibacillus decaturensis TaxID=1413211 RepID=A0A135L3S1_9BACI|nr:protein-glutamate O-methyltransferase CheR [Tepidibacillus decaturensis]KXG43635.1 chemotaxis protein CheR [Tepidibacillus decaturensis]
MTALDQDYYQFIQKIKKKTGIDLSLYKEAQMKRRLNSLRMKRGYANFVDYFHALEKDQQLFAEMLDRMTINVTEFFRNYSRWKVLTDKVIHQLPDQRKIKCWSAACSTGEEPYTLMMILANHFPHLQVELLATDLDEGALKKAAEAIYTERSIQEVPKEMLNKYFVKQNQVLHVIPEIKNKIKFRKHNLLSDPFDKNFDLIICRNVMIYFTEEAKNHLYQKFSQALKPGGVLFVGSTEQIFNPAQYQLETIDTFFYRKIR